MSVYCITVGDGIYYGSTCQRLSERKANHNFKLRNGTKNKLYEKARELGIYILDLQLLYEGDDYKTIEHEFIVNNENCLNMNGAIFDRDRALQKHREAQRRYYYKKKMENYNLS